MKEILWIEDIVESTPIISFFSTSSVDMVGFVNPHKVVFRRNAFLTLTNAQNGSVSKMKVESFGHGRLKHPFSQVQGDLDL
jgi:hypothetical protein